MPSIATIAERETTELRELLIGHFDGVNPKELPSFYSYQPLLCSGLLKGEQSPGVLFDVGPLPAREFESKRALHFTCASGGRLGEFLMNFDNDHLFREAKRADLDENAEAKFTTANSNDACVAQVALEAARHSLRINPLKPEAPPAGVIYHIALAPLATSRTALTARYVPLLGVAFVAAPDDDTVQGSSKYQYLVDHSLQVSHILLQCRARLLLGLSEDEPDEINLVVAPPADDSIRMTLRVLLALHWFFPTRPYAFLLLSRLMQDETKVRLLYADHGWTIPTRPAEPVDRSLSCDELLTRVSEQIQILHDCLALPSSATSPNIRMNVATALTMVLGECAFLKGGKVGRIEKIPSLGKESVLRLEMQVPAKPNKAMKYFGLAAEEASPGEKTRGGRAKVHSLREIQPYNSRWKDKDDKSQVSWMATYVYGRLARALCPNTGIAPASDPVSEDDDE